MSSETNIFTCEFCGQVSIGKDECDCWQARRAKRIADQISRASLAIADEHIDLMNNIAELIANEKLNSASLTLVSGTKAKLTRGAKGAIKVERSETKKSSTEVD